MNETLSCEVGVTAIVGFGIFYYLWRVLEFIFSWPAYLAVAVVSFTSIPVLGVLHAAEITAGFMLFGFFTKAVVGVSYNFFVEYHRRRPEDRH